MKARDIIPGWPRGRSTSRPLADPFRLYRAKVVHVIDRGLMDTVGIDHRFMQDWAQSEAEERRKAEMMEEWHLQNRRVIWDGFKDHWEWARLVITPYGFGPWEPLNGQHILNPRQRIQESHP